MKILQRWVGGRRSIQYRGEVGVGRRPNRKIVTYTNYTDKLRGDGIVDSALLRLPRAVRRAVTTGLLLLCRGRVSVDPQRARLYCTFTSAGPVTGFRLFSCENHKIQFFLFLFFSSSIITRERRYNTPGQYILPLTTLRVLRDYYSFVRYPRVIFGRR